MVNITTKLVKKLQSAKFLLVLDRFYKATMLKISTKVIEVQNFLEIERQNNKSIGFVPTMGALHKGHLSLIRRSRSENDCTIASVFVNPTQFNDPSDFDKYPRTIQKDTEMLREAGCSILFLPSESEIYPDSALKSINFSPGPIAEVLEGAHRPGHFAGVAAVVKRLLDIVQPHRAYFGLKDYQQFLVIKKLQQFYQIPTQIIGCETLREPDGLAMSSRNSLLSALDRPKAVFLHQMLQKAFNQIMGGNIDFQSIINSILLDFEENGNFKLDYFDICSANSLQKVVNPEKEDLIICVAAFLGKVRLIDNLIIKR